MNVGFLSFCPDIYLSGHDNIADTAHKRFRQGFDVVNPANSEMVGSVNYFA